MSAGRAATGQNGWKYRIYRYFEHVAAVFPDWINHRFVTEKNFSNSPVTDSVTNVFVVSSLQNAHFICFVTELLNG